VPVYEDRNEVGHPRVAKQIVAHARELPVNDLGVEHAELASDLGLGLPHPLFESCVQLSHREADLAVVATAQSSAARGGVRRVRELSELRSEEVGDLFPDVDRMVADAFERT
jgi:hypothetical protein